MKKNQIKLFTEYYIEISKIQMMISKSIEIIKIQFLKEIIKINTKTISLWRSYQRMNKKFMIQIIIINL